MSKHRKLSDITHLVIHCSATPNGEHVPLTDIDSWHRKRRFKRAYAARLGENGWAGKGMHAPGLAAIGYHLVIRPDGIPELGRRLSETGAHAVDKRHPKGDHRRRYYNDHAIAICLVGTDQFTPEQWDTLEINVTAWQKQFPGLKVIGHRDIDDGKECPCFDVADWLADHKRPIAGHILCEAQGATA